MVTANILQRVFRIEFNGETASSYTIEINDQQYLISASHVFDGAYDINTVKIFHDHQWKDLPVQVMYNSMRPADTIIFKLSSDISPRYSITYSSNGAVLGTWAYFLGFPFGMTTPGGALNNNFPLPFVKAALISSIDGEREGITKLFLDGHNNKGFSGGPVVWHPPNRPQELQIIGTVSGYLTESPIHSETRDNIEEHEYNAGIIDAFWI